MEVNFMCFWWFMLICDMIIPIVMVIVGRMMWKHCPKHINGMRKHFSDKDIRKEVLENMIRQLTKDSFLEQ